MAAARRDSKEHEERMKQDAGRSMPPVLSIVCGLTVITTKRYVSSDTADGIPGYNSRDC